MRPVTVIRSPCRTLSGRRTLERIGWNSRFPLYAPEIASLSQTKNSIHLSLHLVVCYPTVPATTIYRRPYILHGCRSPPSQHVNHAFDPLLPLWGSTLVLLLSEISFFIKTGFSRVSTFFVSFWLWHSGQCLYTPPHFWYQTCSGISCSKPQSGARNALSKWSSNWRIRSTSLLHPPVEQTSCRGWEARSRSSMARMRFVCSLF